MKQRILGGTGISVSEFALGTMMLGAMGNTDHDESVRMIHTALDAGINFVDTADVYSAGESEEIVGRALAGPPRRRGPGHQVRAPAGERSQPARRITPLDRPRRRAQPPAPGHRPHRPLPDAPSRLRHGHRRDAGRPLRPDPRGQGPGHRLFHLSRRADRGGPLDGRAARPPPVPHRAAALLDPATGPSKGRCSRRPSATGWASSPTARSAVAGSPAGPTRPRGTGPREWGRGTSTSRVAANRAKLEAVQQLTHLAAEAGLPLTHLATAFVRSHPGGHLGHHRSPHTRAARRSPGRSRCRTRR